MPALSRRTIAFGVAAMLACGAAIASMRLVLPRGSGASFGAMGHVACPYGAGDAGAVGPDSTDLAYDKHCAADSDCALGTHLLDCCGTLLALGVNAAEARRFSGSVDACGVRATCRCAGRGVFAEDGTRSRDDLVFPPRDVAVACVAGACASRVVATPVSRSGAPSMASSGAGASAGACAGATASTPVADHGDCPLPSPADCSTPAACKPSTCICRHGAWVCTPDCGGCRSMRAVPVPWPPDAAGR